eukprot:324427-Hanusia_phi.AAC.2
MAFCGRAARDVCLYDGLNRVVSAAKLTWSARCIHTEYSNKTYEVEKGCLVIKSRSFASWSSWIWVTGRKIVFDKAQLACQNAGEMLSTPVTLNALGTPNAPPRETPLDDMIFMKLLSTYDSSTDDQGSAATSCE